MALEMFLAGAAGLVVVEGEEEGGRESVDVGGFAEPLTVAGPPNNDGCCVTVTECRLDVGFFYLFLFLKQEGRGDVMSVSELRGHIKEPPLGGESGPELAGCEDEEDDGPDVD